MYRETHYTGQRSSNTHVYCDSLRGMAVGGWCGSSVGVSLDRSTHYGRDGRERGQRLQAGTCCRCLFIRTRQLAQPAPLGRPGSSHPHSLGGAAAKAEEEASVVVASGPRLRESVPRFRPLSFALGSISRRVLAQWRCCSARSCCRWERWRYAWRSRAYVFDQHLKTTKLASGKS